MVDASTSMQDRITRGARLAGDRRTVDLAPRRPDRLVFDFHRTDDLIAHGVRSGERAIDSIPGGDPYPGAASDQR